MGTLLFAGTALLSIIGALLLAFSILAGGSAPQQAAGAAMAIGLAVIPYVLARVYQLSKQAELEEARHSAVLNALREMPPANPTPAAYAEVVNKSRD